MLFDVDVRIAKRTNPLCFLPNGQLVCYRHGRILLLQEGLEMTSFRIPVSCKEHLLGWNRYVIRLLRLGIRCAIAIDNGHVVISIGNKLHEVNLIKGSITKGWFCGNGIRPLILSDVKNVGGFDDGIYFGGYLSNIDKKPVNIYRRTGEDEWIVVYTFPKGTINHVHNIVADPYRKCLWIFTGDFYDASAIWKVTDNFKKVERMSCNDQKYRGCVVYALPEGLLYATDAPFTDNYIYLMNPETREVKEVFSIHGSCIYGCKWKDKYVFSSTVEGDGRDTPKIEFLFGRKRGAGIKDDFVHMYMGNLKEGFTEIYKEKKDCMPYYTFQFGVFKFPDGMNNCDTLYFQPVATNEHDLNLMTLSIE